MKKTTLGILALTLVAILGPLAVQAAPFRQQDNKEPFWRAEYYDNQGLTGKPRYTASEDSITHDWGEGSPSLNIPSNHFSARYTGRRHFERGSYLFVLTVDDGARVWFDGELILDYWTIGRKVRLRHKLFIEQAGYHEIQVAYFENVGTAIIALEVLELGNPQDIVSSWNGEYFTNQRLEGRPNLVRRDPEINFDWTTGSPDPNRVPRDRFSVRWTRNTYLITADYRIRIRHDDGMRIFINDEKIYDSWQDQSATNKAFTKHIEEGYYTIIVEYYDHIGDAVAQVEILGTDQ
jgi:hypothetical protein